MQDRDWMDRLVAAISERVSQSGYRMTLSLARKLTDAVCQRAKAVNVNAVVAVSDESGNPVLVTRMDDAFIASYDIALNKAYTVVALKTRTSELKKLAQPGGELYGIQFTNQGRIVVFGGGVPLVANGKVVGGLGVSGGTEPQDTDLAEYGSKAWEQLIGKGLEYGS